MNERAPEPTVDVLLVGVRSTPGLRLADEQLARSLERAGARVAVTEAVPPREVRTLALTDLLWARAARRAAREALRRFDQPRPPAVIYSTTTAALLWPLPGAIRFDAPAAANRPGRHGLWQRPLERRRLRHAPLLLPWSEGGLAEARAAVPGCEARALVLSAPVVLDAPPADGEPILPMLAGATSERSAEAPGRDIAALTYAGNPHKKGFDRVLAAWRRAHQPGERLVVVGIARERLHDAGFELPDADIHVTGPISAAQLRGLLGRTRVFLCAPRREDYGLIQLEALAEGCRLVTTPAPGPYVALTIARELDRRLVSEDLAVALRAALDTPTAGYATHAARLVEPFGRAAIDRLVAEELLPRLLCR
ncbi:MAG TPA: glycosyltransferase [Solirubrobacteraceae bacterium]|jgi:glycosyltransferase involved in cell wall biosynthesis